MQLLSNPCCESASQVLVMAAGSYYTGSRQDSRGFFVHTALGAGLMNLKYNNQPYFNESTLFRPALELGSGWQFMVGNTRALRCKTSATFGPFKGAFTSTSVSFGF
jgi:hypothetical protein